MSVRQQVDRYGATDCTSLLCLTFLESTLYDGNESCGEVEQWLLVELAVGHLTLRWQCSSWHRPAATVHAAETLPSDRWGVQCNYVGVHLDVRPIYSPAGRKEERETEREEEMQKVGNRREYRHRRTETCDDSRGHSKRKAHRKTWLGVTLAVQENCSSLLPVFV